MSLITDTQKKNAGIKEPTIKPVKTALPELQPAPITEATSPQDEVVFSAPELPAQPSPVPPEQQLPAIPEGQTPPAGAEQNVLGETSTPEFDFSLTAPVEIQQAPPKAIPATLPIWQDTTEQLGYGAPLKTEVVNSSLPSFSVQTPSNNRAINQAYSSLNSSIVDANTAANQEYVRAQQVQADLSKRGALPNTPDATKKWYSAPLGFLGDVLFGTERARKLSEQGIADYGAGSFGRQGAGVGGQINYLMNTLPNLFVAATGEANTVVANSLQSLGVSKETAEGFARDGFLTFLPNLSLQDDVKAAASNVYKKLPLGGFINSVAEGITGLKPSQILNFNFDEANKRNLFIDAIAGDPLNDINDPDGSVKYGRIYTRSQRKEGSSSTDDPIGFALQMGTYLFNPGEIPGDTLISAGINKLWRTIRPGKAATQAVGEVVSNLPAPPSSEVRREAQLAVEAQAARTSAAGRRITQPSAEVGQFGFDLSSVTEEQLRNLNVGTPRLNGSVAEQRAALSSTGELSTTNRGFIEPTTTNTTELNLPRLDGGEATLDFEPYVQYPTISNKPYAANPQSVPRAYIGASEVTRAPLPPAFEPDLVPNKIEDGVFTNYLPYNTPARTALELGLGNPNIRIESPGALAIRPLAEIKEIVNEINPKLLETFEGTTWAEFKDHLSVQFDDIGRFSSVGAETRKPVRQVSMSNIRSARADELKTQILTSDRADVFDTTLGEVDDVQNLTEAFLRARTSKGEDQINAGLQFSVLQKEKLSGRGDELNSFVLREIYDTPEAAAVIRRKLDSLVQDKTQLDRLTELALGSFKSDEQSKFDFGLLFKQVAKGKLDEYNRFRTGEFWNEPEITGLVNRKFDELLNTDKKSVDLVGTLQNRSPVKPVNEGKVKLPTEDDLLTAAEELAQHKLALDKPLQQLDELFDETVDFGRKTVDEVPYDLINRGSARTTVDNGGILKLTPRIFLDDSKQGVRLRDAWLNGDYDYLTTWGKRNGFSFDELLNNVIDRNNTYIAQANRIYSKLELPEAITKLDGNLFHGTALDQWTPPDNLYVNGSRGELGGGTYYTLDKQVAGDYARARVGDNVNPKTMDYDVNPTIAEVEPKFTATLDARLPLEKNKLKRVFSDLPEPVYKKFSATLGRKKKPQSYVQLRAIMEESIVKAGVEPTEELLQQIDADISKNLRSMGFDSVLDSASRFVLSLDNARVSVKGLENVPAPSVIESTTARLNADAYTASKYPDLLTTDANLRDSNYKVLAQTRAEVDKKLTQVQDEIIKRGLPEQDTILPKQPDTDTKPQSFLETADELSLDDVCGI